MSRPLPMTLSTPWLPSGMLALLAHVLVLLLLVIGVQWQNPSARPVQAELWEALPPVRTPPVQETPPTPAPATDPAPPPPPPAVPQSAAMAAEATPEKPDIALHEPKPAQSETPRPETSRPETPRPETPRPTQDKTDETRLRAQEEALRQLDRAAREKERLAKAEDALKLLDRTMRAQESAQAAVAAREARGDTSIRTLNSYVDRITAKIKENTLVPPTVPAGAQLTVAFTVLPDGSVLDGSIRVVRGSGVAAYDEAVQRGILAAQPLPLPDDPALRRQMRDMKVTTKNVN